MRSSLTALFLSGNMLGRILYDSCVPLAASSEGTFSDGRKRLFRRDDDRLSEIQISPIASQERGGYFMEIKRKAEA